MNRPILEPGVTCATLIETPESGVLVDGRDFYRAVYKACSEAERTILMTGWQFATEVELMRGKDAECCDHPTEFLAFLKDLCEKKPDLEIFLLAWDASAVFTFEREPLQKLRFWRKGHERIHYQMDNSHPVGASHHQKLVLVDRAIAMMGGMDVCTARWDDRSHKADAPERCNAPGGKIYDPYHDVQAYLTGTGKGTDAIDTLRGWFCDRWKAATGDDLELPFVEPRAIQIDASFKVEAPRIALTRTMPAKEADKSDAITEIYELHLRAIADAQRLIYIENQYLSSNEIAEAFVRRFSEGGPPLEVVIVLPEKSAGFKERISIGVYQAENLKKMTAAAERSGHHLGVYYACACGDEGEVPVFIHAKVLAVDDRFLLVSSANTSNRSMTFDSELGMAWEAPEATESLRNARIELLGEHVGMTPYTAKAELAEITGLVARLDAIARAKSHKLRIHCRNVGEKPGWLLSKFLPSETPLDPDHSMAEELLPEGGSTLDRIVRDPFVLMTHGVRQLGRRLVRTVRR